MISTKADITFFYSVIVKVGDIVKNKLKLLLLLLLLLLSLVSFIQVSYSKKTIDSKKNHVETIPYDTTPSFLTNQTQELSQLKAVVSIPGTDLLENVVQADDNQFYQTICDNRYKLLTMKEGYEYMEKYLFNEEHEYARFIEKLLK